MKRLRWTAPSMYQRVSSLTHTGFRHGGFSDSLAQRRSRIPASVSLRKDYSAEELRRLAKTAETVGQGRRLLSLAAVRDGMSRADAARIGQRGFAPAFGKIADANLRQAADSKHGQRSTTPCSKENWSALPVEEVLGRLESSAASLTDDSVGSLGMDETSRRRGSDPRSSASCCNCTIFLCASCGRRGHGSARALDRCGADSRCADD